MNQKPRFATLDSLRGFAALSVCLFHFSTGALPKVYREELDNLFWWGYLGVDVFFVISGFIIPYVLLKSKYTLANYGNFIGKRFLRICPPSWISILLVILQWVFIDLFMPSASGVGYMEQVSVPRVVHSMLYTIPFTELPWINGVLWTLAIEFQFYLLIGLLFPLMIMDIRYFLLVALLMLVLFFAPFSAPLEFFNYSALFLMGFVTLLFFEKKINLPAFLALVTCFTVASYFQGGLIASLFGLGTALAIAFVRFGNRVTSFLGKISYSFYLIHLAVGAALEVLFTKIIPPQGLLNCVIIIILCLAGTILLSWLFYRTVELFFINLANRLYDTAPKYKEGRAVQL